MEYIAFTGHRNKTVDCSDLERILQEHPDATWVHGGAVGFDTQVAQFARQHGIPQICIRPDYSKGRAAPLIRDREIVDKATLLYACYDGRTTGGTYYTVKYARSKHKPVIILRPIQD